MYFYFIYLFINYLFIENEFDIKDIKRRITEESNRLLRLYIYNPIDLIIDQLRSIYKI